MSEERVLYEAHPAMFRNHPIWFVVTMLLCLVGVGFLILIPWWVQSRGTTLTVTTERTRLRRGLLSKNLNVVFHDNVRNIQIRQTAVQRLLNVGYVGVASAGHAGMEIEVDGLPRPAEVKQLIDRHRRR